MIDNRESIDPVAQKLIKLTNDEDIETIFSRVKKQQPQCGFGISGVC